MKNLYDAEKYMVRYPFRNVEELGVDGDIILKAAKNNVFMEQILISSKSTYDMIINYIHNNKNIKCKKIKKLEESIYKYWNRSCTRTTPFGLFSKVNIGDFDKKEKILIDPKEYCKKVNLDIKWLNKFIKLLEINECKKLSYFINEAVYCSGNRAYLLYCVDQENTEKININASNLFISIKNLANSEISYKELLNNIIETYGNEYEELGKDYLNQLISNEYLISSIRFSLTDENMLNTLINNLKSFNIDEKYLKSLLDILDLIILYEKLPIGDGIDIYLNIIEKMSKLVKSEHYLQVDLFGNDNVSLSNDLKNQIEEFASFLTYMNNFDKTTSLDLYKERFLEKYGNEQEVEITELMDAFTGIGTPDNYINQRSSFIAKNNVKIFFTKEQEQFFLNKYINALNTNNDIEIKSEDLNKICNFNLEKREVPNSLELFFYLNKNEGREELILNDILGSESAGKAFNRFFSLSKHFKETLNYINKRETSFYDSDIEICEICMLPQNSKNGNVVRVLNNKKYEISFFTKNSKSLKNRIKLENILIGIENNKFYAKNKITKKRIVFKFDNMFNTTLMCNELRFLQEISYDGQIFWNIPIWNNIYSKFNYIPRIRYKDIIISNKILKIDIEYFENIDKMNLEEFKVSLKKYLSNFNILNKVCLAYGDNNICIDLENYSDINLIFLECKREYRQNKNNGYVVIKEIDQNSNVLRDLNGNTYNSEIVVPLFKKITS